MMAPKAPYLASAAILYNSRGRSPQPACKAKPITGRTLAAQGRKARRLAQPSRPSGRVNLREYWKAPPRSRSRSRSRPRHRRLNPHARQGLSLKAVNPFGPGPLSSSFSSTTGTPALTRASASTPLPLIFFPLKVPS